jgi:hypothetical protein
MSTRARQLIESVRSGLTATDALREGSAQIREFGKGDWMAFGGSAKFPDGANPLIADIKGGPLGAQQSSVVAGPEGLEVVILTKDYDQQSWAPRGTTRFASQALARAAMADVVPTIRAGRIPAGWEQTV